MRNITIALLLLLTTLVNVNDVSAQLKRTVLYTLGENETINYGEYMVDLYSKDLKFVATVVESKGLDKLIDRQGVGQKSVDYHKDSYTIVMNAQAKTFDWFGQGVYAPEKTVGLDSWNQVTQVWGNNDGYYIKYKGINYGPYSKEPWCENTASGFVFNVGNDLFLKLKGKDYPLLDIWPDMNMYFFENKAEADKIEKTLDLYGVIYYSGGKSNYYYYYPFDKGRSGLIVNGKEYIVDYVLTYNNHTFNMSSDGSHWILYVDNGGLVYVDGNMISHIDGNNRIWEIEGRSNSHGMSVFNCYIDNGGNYIFMDKDKNVIINGKKADIPVGAQPGYYFSTHYESKYGWGVMPIYYYRLEGKTYVHYAGAFEYDDKFDSNTYNNEQYNYANTKGSVMSKNKKHTLLYDWEKPYVSINGQKFGKSPAINAIWNQKRKTFMWNALEGSELVVYEYKPR